MNSQQQPQLSRRKTHLREAPIRDAPGLERLIFFSDAVFAIAITLLVLEIRLPVGAGELDDRQLLAALAGIWPKYLAYAISFGVIGMVWIGHHRKFRMIEAYNRWLLFINLLLLMAVAFIPFPTAVLSESGNRTATIFYALSVLVMGLLSVMLWTYAAQMAGLASTQAARAQIREETLRSAIVPLVFFLSIPLAFLNDDLAKVFWASIIPLLYWVTQRAREEQRAGAAPDGEIRRETRYRG